MDSVNMFSTPNKKRQKNLSPTHQIPLHSQSENKKGMTPLSIKRTTDPLDLLNTTCNTPLSRFPKIINPFEAAFAERLRFPLISSPSLFHRPSTPKLCSTSFEWTIDDVSSLNPVNFEAHENQFISTTDTETEAKAQAAINSYFNENIFVPSPIDCALRNQKIILNDESFMSTNNINASPIVNQPTKRDGCCQTELTFPTILPKNVEEILRPYFMYTMNQQQTPTKDCGEINTTAFEQELRDASLRRKLFGRLLCPSSGSDDNIQQIELADSLSSPPKSPDLFNTKQDCSGNKTRNFGSPQDSHDKSLYFSLSPIAVEENHNSFGSLSPISKNIHSPGLLKMSPKSESLYLSKSPIFHSTPVSSASSSYCHYSTSSTNSINTPVDGGSSVISISSLKRRRRFTATDLKFDKNNKGNSGSFDLNESSSVNNQSQQHSGLSPRTTPPTKRQKKSFTNST